MVPIKRLYLIAGYEGADHERTIAAVRRMYGGNDRRILTRVYPSRTDKQADYLHALVQDAVSLIFGADGATNFCRRQDQPCALAEHDGRGKPRTCEIGKATPVACARARPQLIIVVCADRLFDEVFARLGRAVLILRVPGPVLPDATAVKAALDAFETTAAHVNDVVSNRAKAFYAPLAPYRNFQLAGDHPITTDVQSDLASFGATMKAYHDGLYRADFVNPVKRRIRGAYMLDAQTAFQQDHLHKSVQIIGEDSRRDGFHLLNAFHVYGVKADPGFHFDVMNTTGGAIGRAFTDVLSGIPNKRTETHLNITPCDRLV